jgi:hypothetical protein
MIIIRAKLHVNNHSITNKYDKNSKYIFDMLLEDNSGKMNYIEYIKKLSLNNYDPNNIKNTKFIFNNSIEFNFLKYIINIITFIYNEY